MDSILFNRRIKKLDPACPEGRREAIQLILAYVNYSIRPQIERLSTSTHQLDEAIAAGHYNLATSSRHPIPTMNKDEPSDFVFIVFRNAFYALAQKDGKWNSLKRQCNDRGDTIAKKQLINFDDSTPMDDYHRNEILRKAIDRLPTQQKKAIKLYMRSYKYDEIAEALDITKGTVRDHVRDGKKNLVKILGPDRDELL